MLLMIHNLCRLILHAKIVYVTLVGGEKWNVYGRVAAKHIFFFSGEYYYTHFAFRFFKHKRSTLGIIFGITPLCNSPFMY